MSVAYALQSIAPPQPPSTQVFSVASPPPTPVYLSIAPPSQRAVAHYEGGGDGESSIVFTIAIIAVIALIVAAIAGVFGLVRYLLYCDSDLHHHSSGWWHTTPYICRV